jgi:hypothetical protein
MASEQIRDSLLEPLPLSYQTTVDPATSEEHDMPDMPAQLHATIDDPIDPCFLHRELANELTY